MSNKKNKNEVSSDEKQIVRALSEGQSIPEIVSDKKSKVQLNERQIYFKVCLLKNRFGAKSIPHLVAIFLRNELIK